MALLFKTEEGEQLRARLAAEFETVLDPLLRAGLLDLAQFVESQYGKPVIVTCVLRTPDENKAVGGAPNSSHLTGRAADIRVMIYNSDEIVAIQRYLKHRLADVIHVLYHNGGTGPHIHTNINWAFARQTFAI